MSESTDLLEPLLPLVQRILPEPQKKKKKENYEIT
jgi:hypothetical protein